MITCVRTDYNNPDFKKLVAELDQELAIIDGKDHAFYSRYNKVVPDMMYMVVAYEDGIPAGCGAIKEYFGDTMEIKRMFVPKDRRGHGIATEVLKELEKWALELDFKHCVLETGKRQPDAIKLYTKNGYRVIPNYGPYEGIENSICFEKELELPVTGNMPE